MSAGIRGELKVAKILNTLSESDYTTLNDLMLPINEDGDTVQIDHVVVSTYGVFVIETKNYSGTIYGSEHAEYWKQYFKYQEYQLRNPIIQNQSHVNVLKKIFKQYGDIHLIPLVVFTGDAEIKVSCSSQVIYISKLIQTINNYKTYLLMPQQREKIVNILELANLDSNEDKKEHISRVSFKNIKAGFDIRQGVCPRCGGKLVLRQGRFGPFYGCDNYPKCNFILND